MNNDNSNDDSAGNVGRRRFITLAGVGGVGSITLALPGEWTKPIIDLVTVPAYAQSAPTGKLYLADVFRKSTGTLDDGSDSNDDDDPGNPNGGGTTGTTGTTGTGTTGTGTTGTTVTTVTTVTTTATTSETTTVDIT